MLMTTELEVRKGERGELCIPIEAVMLREGMALKNVLLQVKFGLVLNFTDPSPTLIWLRSVKTFQS